MILVLSINVTDLLSVGFVAVLSTQPWRTEHHSHLKTVFSNFRKVVHQISSAATRNRKETLKMRILMYSIGGWTAEAIIVWPDNSISLVKPVRTGQVIVDGHRETQSFHWNGGSSFYQN